MEEHHIKFSRHIPSIGVSDCTGSEMQSHSCDTKRIFKADMRSSMEDKSEYGLSRWIRRDLELNTVRGTAYFVQVHGILKVVEVS
jgi:hypothetical protein